MSQFCGFLVTLLNYLLQWPVFVLFRLVILLKYWVQMFHSLPPSLPSFCSKREFIGASLGSCWESRQTTPPPCLTGWNRKTCMEQEEFVEATQRLALFPTFCLGLEQSCLGTWIIFFLFLNTGRFMNMLIRGSIPKQRSRRWEGRGRHGDCCLLSGD